MVLPFIFWRIKSPVKEQTNFKAFKGFLLVLKKVIELFAELYCSYFRAGARKPKNKEEIS